MLRRAETSDKDKRRMAIELGGERGISEVRDIQKIFAAERWLVPFLQNIPDRINEHRLKQDTEVLRLVDKCTARFPDHVPVIAAALVDPPTEKVPAWHWPLHAPDAPDALPKRPAAHSTQGVPASAS